MSKKSTNTNRWIKFHGPNLGFVIDQYDRYVTEEGSVDPELKELFQTWGAPPFQTDYLAGNNTDMNVSPQNTANIEKVIAENIASLTFDYLDSSGGSTAVLEDIRFVRITLVARNDDNSKSDILQTRIHARNLGM